jgi:hypothetical protein
VRLIAEGRVRAVAGVVAERVEIINARTPDISALNPQDCPGGDPLASKPG